MKSTYYVASSLDGYIAKEDGDVSWLDDLGVSPEESGYEEFYSTVDALVMGRKTYDKLHKLDRGLMETSRPGSVKQTALTSSKAATYRMKKTRWTHTRKHKTKGSSIFA